MSQKTKNQILILFIFLAAFDVLIWRQIISGGNFISPELYFFDVGQGDSQLILLPSPDRRTPGIRILIDGGPNKERLAEQLFNVLPGTSRYIDLAILSHPQTDHFAGFIGILKNYRLGAFVFNGLSGVSKSYKELDNALMEKSVRKIKLAAGDKIKYGTYVLNFISPSAAALNNKNINKTSLVFILETGLAKTFFTGDIGFETEDEIRRNYDLDADILKVPHHGSKYSSGDKFLKAVTPKVSVIGVGRNSYGHPTQETLSRLTAVGSQIYRTDKNGAIKLIIDDEKISIFTKK